VLCAAAVNAEQKSYACREQFDGAFMRSDQSKNAIKGNRRSWLSSDCNRSSTVSLQANGNLA
jgi:hypothetical protein